MESWKFERREEIPRFFKGLFGLSSTFEEIDLAINHYFDLGIYDNKVLVNWHLIYCY